MSKIRVLVAEDNPIHAGKMEMLLDEMGYETIGVYATSQELMRAFHATKPDLVLLDIELDGQVDGVEIAKKLNQFNQVPIIFVTAREDQATISRAKATDPYAYMLKPVERGSLQASIELAVYRFARDQEKFQELEPFTGWSNDILVKDSFFIKAGSKLEKVHCNDILWVELAEERYCDVVTKNRNYHLRASMTSLGEKLDPARFVRVHRGYIVNAHQVESIDEADMVIEVAGKSIPLGKSYKDQLVNRLMMLR